MISGPPECEETPGKWIGIDVYSHALFTPHQLHATYTHIKSRQGQTRHFFFNPWGQD